MSETILDRLADYARERVEADKKNVSLTDLRASACRLARVDEESLINQDLSQKDIDFRGRFYKALAKPGLSIICEIKKASPSKGVIAEDFPYVSIARAYEDAGADAVSCLTEPKWFLGSDEIFECVRNEIFKPMIRKDFIVDEYQIYQAKYMGADAVLLIVAITEKEDLKRYLNICNMLKLDALVETHNEEEIKIANEVGAKIVGINNRNLKDFKVDTGNALKLKDFINKDSLCVAESGIAQPTDVEGLSEAGIDAVLVGEAMMRTGNKKSFIKKMRDLAS